MRVIETKNGARAVWMPNFRSRGYALLAGGSMVPGLAAAVGVLLMEPSATNAALAVLVMILVAVPLLMIARNSALYISADLVATGSARTPARSIRRRDVVLVRYRGEFGELMGRDEQVLLRIPAFLTSRQAAEVADYLHVPFTGTPTAAPVAEVRDIPGAFVLRPDPGKKRMFMLLAGLFALLGLGGGAWSAIDGKWPIGILLIVGYAILVFVSARWLGTNTLVVTDDTVFKGTRDRNKFVSRSEIADIVYGQKWFLLRAANKSTLLGVDVSFFTRAQAQELADRLGVPLQAPQTSKKPQRPRKTT
ncbi:hypothetical protein KDL01_36360 [Actinospica durhamensis]|uniref:PH domain-containing protein n=1 Tax=Actinospica durhamensis TaxID=1508375 RepID=A0A941IV88_9ACTN|nr:hypothetical protein [Actinospica durhamensis]MBR7838798.1 hypothetical protein [Actinospica durhamensis]